MTPAAIPAGLGITRLGDLTGLDVIGLPVWTAVRPQAWSLAQCQGKGLSPAQAQVSALMEAAETALAEQAGRHVVARGSVQDMLAAGENPLDLGACGKCQAPQRMRGQSLGWLRGYGLATRCPALVPLPLVSLDFRLHNRPELQGFQLSSTGLAAHPDRTAAHLHGLLEQIETDALALARAWPGIQAAAPEPDLPRDDPDLGAVFDRLAAAGMVANLRDLTSDLGVPVVLCWLTETGPRKRQHPSAGIACRPTLAAAARDAMLEAVQSRLTDISAAREDIRPRHYAMTSDTDTGSPPGGLPSLARPLCGTTAAALLTEILGRIAAAGLPEPVAVDLDRPEDGFACVSVICPGLEAGPAGEGCRPGSRAMARVVRHGLGLP
ncbi:MAG: YcaO-like family protein [Paracoccaceae bacterium]